MNYITLSPILRRFAKRQEFHYEQARQDLQAGKKETKWMVYIFPQLRGLARNRHTYFFSLPGRREALAYLAHPVLGPRLRECCALLLTHQDLSATALFGEPDARRLQASMTLFAELSPEGSVFHQVLEHYFDGQPDPLTIGLLTGRILDLTPRKYAIAHS